WSGAATGAGRLSRVPGAVQCACGSRSVVPLVPAACGTGSQREIAACRVGRHSLMRKLLFVFGTRPEAIKLAPLIAETRRKFEVPVCVTAQHREMLDQVVRLFRLEVHHD